jgi:DNA ligase-1
MPKGVKNAPPQQSSLLDMWNKGKRKAAGGPKKEEKDVVLGDIKSEIGALHMKILRSLSSQVLSRRKLSAEGNDQIWSAILCTPLAHIVHSYQSIGPPTKRRRIVASDDDEPSSSKRASMPVELYNSSAVRCSACYQLFHCWVLSSCFQSLFIPILAISEAQEGENACSRSCFGS